MAIKLPSLLTLNEEYGSVVRMLNPKASISLPAHTGLVPELSLISVIPWSHVELCPYLQLAA